MGLGLYFCIWASNYSYSICWKGYPHPTEMTAPLLRSNDHNMMCGYISGLSCSTDHGQKSTRFANTTHCLDYCICTEIWNEVNVSPPKWVFSKIVLSILITLLFHINFGIRCWCIQKILIESWFQLRWLYRSIWGCTFSERFWLHLIFQQPV